MIPEQRIESWAADVAETVRRYYFEGTDSVDWTRRTINRDLANIADECYSAAGGEGKITTSLHDERVVLDLPTPATNPKEIGSFGVELDEVALRHEHDDPETFEAAIASWVKRTAEGIAQDELDAMHERARRFELERR